MIVGSSDGGLDGEEAPPGLADEVVEFLPPSAEYLIWVDSPESRKAARIAKAEIGVLGNLLGQGFKVSADTRQGAPGWIIMPLPRELPRFSPSRFRLNAGTCTNAHTHAHRHALTTPSTTKMKGRTEADVVVWPSCSSHLWRLET